MIGESVSTAIGPVAAPRCDPGGAQWATLENDTHHFQHGPIDLILKLDESVRPVTPDVRTARLDAAWQRFTGLLPELVSELPVLRRAVSATLTGEASQALCTGPVARRMMRACWPYRQVFVTPMAAVAGAVADEVLHRLIDGPVRRAFVNNGGDIALHLAPGETYTVGLVSNPERVKWHAGTGAIDPEGRFTVQAHHGIGGIATSGWRGRSFSLGIADSVTVFAANAAAADVAATLIANQVNADHPAIERAPANTLKDDTDLGDRLVTVDVGPLSPALVREALLQGGHAARQWLQAGLILGAVLVLQGQVECIFPDQDKPLIDTASS